MNHYSFPTLGSLNLEMLWRQRQQSNANNRKKLISLVVKMFEEKIYVVCNEAAKTANVCTWTSAHIFWRWQHFCMYYSRLCDGFSLLFFCCLNSWKGLKNTKHLMVIKVARIHTALATNFQCVSVFWIEIEEPVAHKTTARWSECDYIEWDEIWETRLQQDQSKIPHTHTCLLHSSFINRISLIMYR